MRIRRLTAEIERLEALRRDPKVEMSPAQKFELAGCYFEIGRVAEAAGLIRPLRDTVNDAASLQAMATIFLAAKSDAQAEKVLNKYLKLNPSTDADAWAELAKLQHRTGRKQLAQQSFVMGYRINAQALFNRLQKDQELYEIAAPLFQRRK